nr:PREDICTED: uncharacterized protein LOC109032226 [Bemisia tabaci]
MLLDKVYACYISIFMESREKAQYLVFESECIHIGAVQLPNATILSSTSPDPVSSQGQNIAGRSTPFRILQSEVGQSIDDASPSTADDRWPVLQTRMQNGMNRMMPAKPKSKHSEKSKSTWLKSASNATKSFKKKVSSLGSRSGRFSRTESGFSSDGYGSDGSGRSSSRHSSRSNKSPSGKTKIKMNESIEKAENSNM